MDALKNLGTTLSLHYEKVILSVILLALLGAAAYLPIRVSQNRDTIRAALEAPTRAPKKASQPVDTTTIEQSIRRLRTEPKLTLVGEHNVFNPVTWKRRDDSRLYKVVHGDEEGPAGLVVNAVRPLELSIQFDGASRSGDRLRYKFLVVDESKGSRSSSRPRQVYLSEGSTSKSDPFSIVQVIGPADNPTALKIRFPGSNEIVTVTPETPYRRVAGYEADLAHSKVGTRFNNVRAKQPGGIRLGTQTYNVVAITKDEVTVESSTQKRWTVPLKGSL